MNKLHMTWFCLLLLLGSFLQPGLPQADESRPESPEWKVEFERLCGQTATANSQPPEEIAQLIEDSQKLLGELEKLEDPGKKVYVFRLEKCLSFFEYAQELLEDKE